MSFESKEKKEAFTVAEALKKFDEIIESDSETLMNRVVLLSKFSNDAGHSLDSLRNSLEIIPDESEDISAEVRDRVEWLLDAITRTGYSDDTEQNEIQEKLKEFVSVVASQKL